MLSGKRAFRGDSMAETMSAILREDPPDLSETNKTVSPALDRVVHHCLEKNPAERFHSARDLAFALEALSGSSIVSSQTLAAMASLPVRSRIGKHLPWIVVGVLFVALLAAMPFVVSYFRRAPANAQPLRFIVPPPEKANILSPPTISPDGRRLAFVASLKGRH